MATLGFKTNFQEDSTKIYIRLNNGTINEIEVDRTDLEVAMDNVLNSNDAYTIGTLDFITFQGDFFKGIINITILLFDETEIEFEVGRREVKTVIDEALHSAGPSIIKVCQLLPK